MIFIKRDYTRVEEREILFDNKIQTNEECFICEETLFQIGNGKEEGNLIVPLYECIHCKYREIIVNDNRNAIYIKKENSYW